MTLQEFLDRIDPDAGWRLNEHGQLCDDSDDCPVWHVWRAARPGVPEPDDVFAAAVELGLRRDVAGRIIAAADDALYAQPTYRRKLRAACGVEETGW